MNWKRLFQLEQDEVLGLDIGSSSIKIIQMRKDNDGCIVTAAGIVKISHSSEDEGDENTEIDTAKAINKCLQITGIQTRLAVCSVCGPEVAVRPFRFPSLLSEEIQGAVLLEAEQVFPFNIDESTVDYQSIPNSNNGTSGILVAATNKLIRKKNRAAENASLRCVLMDVDGLALLNCFSEYEKQKQYYEAAQQSQNGISELESSRTIAILNVGNSYTNLVIRGDNTLPFVRDITHGGNDIVSKIAADNDIPTETVNKILFGYENSNQSLPELSNSLAEACEQLITDVTETLRYYTAQEKLLFIKKILVCGGFASAKGFVKLLDNRLPAASVLWNPFDIIRCDAKPQCRYTLEKNGPAMTVAAGLAMRSI